MGATNFEQVGALFVNLLPPDFFAAPDQRVDGICGLIGKNPEDGMCSNRHPSPPTLPFVPHAGRMSVGAHAHACGAAATVQPRSARWRRGGSDIVSERDC